MRPSSLNKQQGRGEKRGSRRLGPVQEQSIRNAQARDSQFGPMVVTGGAFSVCPISRFERLQTLKPPALPGAIYHLSD